MKANADSSQANTVNHKELIALIYKPYDNHILKINRVISDTFNAVETIKIAKKLKNHILNQV